MARATPDLPGQPTDIDDPRRPADSDDARVAGRALRTQRVHPGRDLEHRLVRSVGCRAREAARAADHPRAGEPERAVTPPRQLDERADPPPSTPATRVMTQRTAQRSRRPTMDCD